MYIRKRSKTHNPLSMNAANRVLPWMLALLPLWLLPSCKEDSLEPEGIWFISTDEDYKTTAQEALVNAADYDTVHFRAGVFEFNTQLSVSNKTGIVIRGEGRDVTILDFSAQVAGAQGILATDMVDIIFADLTVRDMAGDGIKVKDSDGISFFRVGAVYTTPLTADNGAYGLYPVTCEDVLIDDCYVRGASDAGIYVGQSRQVHVRNCYVEECVAGIEVENCINADVYGNTATKNTGGILVFDLPSLPVIKNGNTTRVFDNDLINNTQGNFAPPGNAVANIPEGTGIMILAYDRCEVFNNRITGCNTLGIGVVSYLTLEVLDPGSSYDDPDYDPYVYNIHIHDNTFNRSPGYPFAGVLGLTLQAVYTANSISPDIVLDGSFNPAVPEADQKICVYDNGGAQVANVDAVNEFANVIPNPVSADCTLSPLPETAIDAPLLPY